MGVSEGRMFSCRVLGVGLKSWGRDGAGRGCTFVGWLGVLYDQVLMREVT
jgi:hypothetical protein